MRGMTATRRALIVEDDSFFADIFTRLLRSAGLEADVAADVQTARALLSLRLYDAYILDMKLPDGDEDGVVGLVRMYDEDAAGKTAVVTSFPMIARAAAAGFRIIDKASLHGLRQFVDGLNGAES